MNLCEMKLQWVSIEKLFNPQLSAELDQVTCALWTDIDPPSNETLIREAGTIDVGFWDDCTQCFYDCYGEIVLISAVTYFKVL